MNILPETAKRKEMDLKGEDCFEDSSSNKQKINCWGAFSSNGKCILHFFKENMTNSLYEEILEDYLPNLKEYAKEMLKY